MNNTKAKYQTDETLRNGSHSTSPKVVGFNEIKSEKSKR